MSKLIVKFKVSYVRSSDVYVVRVFLDMDLVDYVEVRLILAEH